jgi:hypothetical protein
MEMRGEDASRWLEKSHMEERSIVNHTDINKKKGCIDHHRLHCEPA